MSTEINAAGAAESAVETGFDVDGNISDENMAAALTGGDIDLDTDSGPVVEDEAKLEQGQDAENLSGADGAPKETDAGNDDVPRGVLSKSGESIIPYRDLIKERDGRHTERARADGLQDQLNKANERLNELVTPVADDPEGNPDIDAQDTDTESPKIISKEALNELIEDYPESGSAIMALVKSNELLVKQVGDLATQSEENALTSDMQEHFDAIGSKHKDYTAILGSEKFNGWIDGMPALPKAAYQKVFNEGTAEEVVSMLDDFLAGTTGGDGTNSNTDNATDIAKKVADAEAKVNGQQSVPASLTDVPGTVHPHDEQNALMEMPQSNFMDKMSNLSASDQLALMDKMI